MLNFQFYQSVKVLYGEGSVNQLGELVTLTGGKKALVVADPGMEAAGVVDTVLEGLKIGGVEAAVFANTVPNPLISGAEAAYELYVAECCDSVIGVGGGSNMDCAKGVQILVNNPAPLMQYVNFNKPFDVGSGLILIPTTAGTGSEISDGAILSDENHIKFNFVAAGSFAEYAVVDPELMAGMPAGLTAATGLDALTHLIESMTGTLSTDVLRFFAEKGIEEIAEYLPRAVANGKDMEARRRMAVAASVGGFGLVYGHTVAGHSIGQTIGGYFNIPHGMACAYAEPWVLQFNAPAVPEETKFIAKALGAEFDGTETAEEIGVKAKDAFIDFRDNKCKLPPITTFDYDERLFDEIAEVCEKEFFQQFNRRKMDKAACLTIIKSMYGKLL